MQIKQQGLGAVRFPRRWGQGWDGGRGGGSESENRCFSVLSASAQFVVDNL